MPLIDELRAAWPPAEPAGDARYAHASLEGTTPISAWELEPSRGVRAAVAIAGGPGEQLSLVPLAGAGSRWRRAAAGDGVAAALVRVLARGRPPGPDLRILSLRPSPTAPDWPPETVAPRAVERAIGVDQTNESVVVGDAVVVKWIRSPSVRPHPAPVLLAHLAEVGFAEMPRPYASLEWLAPSGATAICALVDAYLPGATDGWGWCVDRLADHLDHPARACDHGCQADVGPMLGSITARLHVALATPSSVIPAPVTRARPVEARAWLEAAQDMLAQAVRLADGPEGTELAGWQPRLRRTLDRLGVAAGALVTPIHGDLHAGQVLRWDGGYAVLDFDGNPVLELPPDSTVPYLAEPPGRDVAQMSLSLDHIGRVVDRRTGGRSSETVRRWIARNRTLFLDAYRDTLRAAGRAELLDERLLPAFEVEQECRELAYAAHFLPDWRYAPMAALREMMR